MNVLVAMIKWSKRCVNVLSGSPTLSYYSFLTFNTLENYSISYEFEASLKVFSGVYASSSLGTRLTLLLLIKGDILSSITWYLGQFNNLCKSKAKGVLISGVTVPCIPQGSVPDIKIYNNYYCCTYRVMHMWRYTVLAFTWHNLECIIQDVEWFVSRTPLLT